jgi:hypothetical protein
MNTTKNSSTRTGSGLARINNEKWITAIENIYVFYLHQKYYTSQNADVEGVFDQFVKDYKNSSKIFHSKETILIEKFIDCYKRNAYEEFMEFL